MDMNLNSTLHRPTVMLSKLTMENLIKWSQEGRRGARTTPPQLQEELSFIDPNRQSSTGFIKYRP